MTTMRALIAIMTLPGALACARIGLAEDRPSAPPAQQVDAFLDWFWQHPLRPQGSPPEHLAAIEARLEPQSCGDCHPRQLEDWRASRHRRAMGPGVTGQLVAMATASHQDCLRCHAPLAEQAASLATAAGGLHEQGLVCAACHLRDYRWYGPARRDGSTPAPRTPGMPHGGWTASPAFEESRFCAACHQFAPDGFALNGKLLENTYAEWRESAFAERGITCQGCHMPQRRHLWKGIHDPDMVARGVTIDTTPPRAASEVSARLVVRNAGTGHYFPTYVTPLVAAEIHQSDADGRAIEGTQERMIIARMVPLDLSRELFDTRIAPGDEAVLRYRRPLAPGARFLVYRVRVEPDAFYERFFRRLLEGDLDTGQRGMIASAYAEAVDSAFVLHESVRPIRR